MGLKGAYVTFHNGKPMLIGAHIGKYKQAKAAGFKLGRLLSIDEGYNYPIYRTMEAYGKGGDVSAMPAPAPAIEPGSQDIAVTVNLRYEIR